MFQYSVKEMVLVGPKSVFFIIRKYNQNRRAAVKFAKKKQCCLTTIFQKNSTPKMKILTCKFHCCYYRLHQILGRLGYGGSHTEKSLNKLNQLTEKELLAEISDLRATIAPNICQKRKVKLGGKFKMVNFTIDLLRVFKKCSETRKRYHCQRG